MGMNLVKGRPTEERSIEVILAVDERVLFHFAHEAPVVAAYECVHGGTKAGVSSPPCHRGHGL